MPPADAKQETEGQRVVGATVKQGATVYWTQTMVEQPCVPLFLDQLTCATEETVGHSVLDPDDGRATLCSSVP